MRAVGPPRRGAPRAAIGAAVGALILMPLLYLPQLHYVHSLPKVTVFRLTVVAILLAGGLRLLADARREGQVPPDALQEGRVLLGARRAGWAVAGARRVLGLRPSDVLLAAFLAWLGVTSAFSDHPAASLLGLAPRFEGFLGFLGVGTFYWTASRATTRQARALLGALTLSGALLGVLAVLEMLGPYRPPGFEAFGLRAVSTLGNPVFVGAWLTLSIPATLAYLALAVDRYERVAAVVTLAPQAAALYLTTARGAWLGAALGLAVTAVALAVILRPSGGGRSLPRVRPPWRGRILRYVAAGSAAILLAVAVTAALRPDVGASAGARVGEAVAAAQDEAGGSVRTRLLMWRATAGLVARDPLLGRGLETFLGDFPRVRPLELVRIEGADAYPDRPHSHWLYLAFSGGAPALALYLLFLGSVAGGAARTIVRGEGAWQRRATLGALLGAATAFEVQSLFSFTLPWTAAGAACVWGLLAALSRARGALPSLRPAGRSRTPGVPGTPPPAHRVAGLLMGVALIAAAIPFASETIRQVAADRDFARVRTRPWDALELTARAVRLSPRDVEYVLGRGEQLERIAGAGGDASAYAEAIALYREAERRIPPHPDVAFSIARVLTASGDVEAAMTEYDALLARDPYHGAALFNLGLLSLQTGDPSRAIAPLRTLTSSAPSDAEAWYYLGRAYEETGNISRATGSYRRAVEAVPGYPGATQALERLGGS